MGESSAMKNDFPTLLKVFLTDYLQVQRGASMNTVSTYRDTFVGLIEFLSVKKGIRPAAIQMKDFCHGVSDHENQPKKSSGIITK